MSVRQQRPAAVVAALLALLVVAAADVPGARAQAGGTVSGQVRILERDGESTEDLVNTIVFLEPVGAAAHGKPAPATTTMALQKRNFEPHVVVVPQGSKVEFPNQDSFSHNVFSKASIGAFDTDVFGRGKTKSNVFRAPGVYPLYCNIHPRMTGYVLAVTTPHYTRAGQDGRWTLENVPPGKYVLHVWHDRAGEKTRELQVAAAAMPGVNFELDARGFKYVQHKNKFGQDYTNASGDRY